MTSERENSDIMKSSMMSRGYHLEDMFPDTVCMNFPSCAEKTTGEILVKPAKIYFYAEGSGLRPTYADLGSSGVDLRANIKESVIIKPGYRVCVPTGLKVVIPQNFEIQLRPRSGLAMKNGVTVLNSPGTIDSSYRGEIKVILINHGSEPFTIEPRMRIAQAVCAQVTTMVFESVSLETFNSDFQSSRGTGGFGSTGTQ